MSLQEFMGWAVDHHGCELSEIPEKFHDDLTIARLRGFVVVDIWSPKQRQQLPPSPFPINKAIRAGSDELAFLQYEDRMPKCIWVTAEGAEWVSSDANHSPDEINHDDWPRQSEVARRLGTNRMAVKRLIKQGHLTTNQKEGHDCRVDPASVLKYCKINGVAYNDT